MIALALRSCLSPRIGRRRAFSLPWSHSTRLLAYCSVRCQDAGSSSSSTAGYTGALSVVTSTGVALVAPSPARRIGGRNGLPGVAMGPVGWQGAADKLLALL